MEKLFFLIIILIFLMSVSGVVGVGDSCGGDADCPFGERCSNGACVKSCSLNSDCPWNFPRCDEIDKVCVGCTSDGDCPPYGPLSGFQCSYEETCIQKFCIGNFACPNSFLCINNKCKQPSNSECFYEPDYLSFNGICESMACTQDANCPSGSGMKCTNNVCKKPCDISTECNIFSHLFLCNLNTKVCESSKTCSISADCQSFGSIYICSNGICMEDCSLGGECPDGTICNSGTKKCALSVNCDDDLDCTIQYGSSYSCNLATQKCQKSACDPTKCNGYICDVAGNCKTSCTVVDDCNSAAGYTCNANKCTKSCQKNPDCTLGAEYQCVNFKCKKMSCLTPTQTPSDCPFGGMVCDSDKICKNKCTVTGDCTYLSNGYNTGCSIINNLCTVGPACTDDTICISTFGVGAKCGANKLCAPPDCKTTLCPENYLCTSAIGCAKFSCTSDANCAIPLDGVFGSCDKTIGFCYNDCKKTGCPPNPAGTTCNTVTKKCEKSFQISCVGDADCPLGKICVGGACTDIGKECNNNADCKIGFECSSFKCVQKKCNNNNECSAVNIGDKYQVVCDIPNTNCVAQCLVNPCEWNCNIDTGACVADPACKNRDNSDKCPAWQTCNVDKSGGTTCVTNISSADANCPTGYQCDNNLCKIIPLPPGTCTNDAGCTGLDEKCVNTKCINTKAKSCVELGGITCESGYECADTKTSYNSLTSAKCCIAKTGEKAECVSSSQVFVPSQADEVFVKKGACVNGKRDVYYCDEVAGTLNCPAADKTSEDCTAITKKGSSTDIPSFGLYAGVVALIVIIVYYLVFHRKEKKNVKKKSRRKILR